MKKRSFRRSETEPEARTGHKRPADSHRRRNTITALLAMVIVLLLLIAVYALFFRDTPQNNLISISPWYEEVMPQEEPEQTEPEQTEPVEKLTDTIDIPGYGSLHLLPDACEQELVLPNPPQNFCYFEISLSLSDGTFLWTSDLIAPGENSEPVLLSQPLETGVYENAVLHYACFTMDDSLTPLNSAQTKLTLSVY